MHDTYSSQSPNKQTTRGTAPLADPDPAPDGRPRPSPPDDPEGQRLHLLQEMRDLKVALKVAQKLVVKYDADYLLEKLRQVRHAVKAGLAQNPPGWFVASVNQNWGPPFGYDPDAHLTHQQRVERLIAGHEDIVQT